jgi:hypothetical protein
MSYWTPHHVREYLFATCLRINHEYILHCQRRTPAVRMEILTGTYEIDLCGRLADFFGRAGHLVAQGQASSSTVTGPSIRCEVKFFRPFVKGAQSVARSWLPDLCRDWTWLLKPTNNGAEFSKRAWVALWPSTELFKFTNCLSVKKSFAPRY